MIVFSKDFYQSEYRCDYLVTEKQKKVWAVEIDLLNEFVNVCNKYNIKYSACAGTLLGAVRHGGFIPWDDDIDVCMLREDFEKLLDVADKEFKEPYFLQTSYNDTKYFARYARLRNSDTTGIIVSNDTPEYHNGIYIDIFVMDGMTQNRKKLEIQLKKLNFLTKAIDYYYNDLSRYEGNKKGLLWLIKNTVNRIFTRTKLVDYYDRIIQKYRDSDYVTTLTQEMDEVIIYDCLRKEFQNLTELPFENLSISCFKNYDAILSHIYGAYMEFPPVEKRGLWHEGKIIFEPDIPYKQYYELQKTTK